MGSNLLLEPGVGRPGLPAPRRVEVFSNSRIARHASFLLGMLLVNKLGPLGNVVCLVILAAMAVRGPLNAFKSLSIVAMIIISSDVLVQRGVVFSVGKFVILLIAGLTLARHSRKALVQPEQLALLAFGGVAGVLALVSSQYLVISLLKLSTFVFGVVCLLSLANCSRDIAIESTEWLLSMIVMVFLLSLLFYLVGQGDGEFEGIWGDRFIGFRGAASHPQTMGVIAAMFAIYLTALLVFVRVPRPRVLLLTVAGLLYFVYLSQARTGLLGYFLAVGLVLFLQASVAPGRNRGWMARQRLRMYKASLVALLVAGGAEVFSGGVSARLDQFIAKDDATEQLALSDVFLQSRERQINEAWDTFLESPITGIGFGTDNSPLWSSRISMFSASTEKGFLPTAVLEEIGIVGAVFFLIFVVVLSFQLFRKRRYLALSMFWALLIFNMAEMMFFSLGGMGLMCWVVVGAALTLRNELALQSGKISRVSHAAFVSGKSETRYSDLA